MLRILLKFVLRILARRTLKRYQPFVIGITGSVGKTTAKEAIYAALSRKFVVWKNAENFNNEIGVPMAVLGIRPRGDRMRLGIDIIRAAWHAYGERRRHYPRYLVLELAADRPGDIAYLVDMVRPQLGVITAIGEVPVHVEHYASPQEVAREKGRLVEALPRHAGLAVLNADDPIVMGLAKNIKAPMTTFGFSKTATYYATDVSFSEQGLSFHLNHANTFVPFRIPRLIALHQLYGILAAIAVGRHLGMNFVEIADALDGMELPRGRMAMMPGIRGSTIIDDSYNASPLSMRAALETLKALPGKRKVALLGEMAELGKYFEQEQRAIDEHAKKCADVVMWCKGADELLPKIQELIGEGDLVLVKGSQNARMERVVKAIMAQSEKAKDLLVRQSESWLKQK